MPLRVAFDMDGVLADFSGAYHAVEERIFGPAAAATRAGNPEEETGDNEERVPRDGKDLAKDLPKESKELSGLETGNRRPDTTPDGKDLAKDLPKESKEPSGLETGNRKPETGAKSDEPPPESERARAKRIAKQSKEARRRRDTVWRAIQAVPDFWCTLKPTEEGAVKRIHDLMQRHRWEVFFITQRPATEGDTVQRQTQRWLVEQGFDWPSVLVIAGSRGAAAGALRLDFHVDDSPKNCLDVKSESRARPLLIVDPGASHAINNAHRLGIGTAPTISAALDILEEACTTVKAQPSLFSRLAKLVGWQ
jgi:phosphoglycolate phosphatase-like HAD superfamily hydrolase